jgi:glutathionylspermidine synthase
VVKFGCFELLGFDFMIDENLSLKLIEINVNPALFTDTTVQQQLLPELIDQTVAIALKLHGDQTERATEEAIEEIKKFDKFELLLRDN